MKKRLLSALLSSCMMITMTPNVFYADASDISKTSKIDAGGNFSSIIDENGSLWTFGNNYYGQLGTGDVETYSNPTKVMDNVIYTSAGSYHLSIVDNNGSLWTCGWNNSGQLGYEETGETTGIDNTSINSTPKKVMDNVIFVSSGDHSTAAIKSDGTLWTWGDGDYNPIQQMSNVKSVDIKNDNGLILKTDGSLWGFGSNLDGILGENLESNEKVSIDNAVKIMDDVANMELGYTHAAAIKTDGSLWTWGSNSGGQLGLGTYDFEKHFTPIKIMDNVQNIEIGGSYGDSAGAFTAVVTKNSELIIWGNQGRGIFANSYNSTTNSVPRITIMDSEVVSVAAGSDHILAKKEDGSFWGVGRRKEGQLGNGEFPYDDEGQTTPIQIILDKITSPSDDIIVEESGLVTSISDNISIEDKETINKVLTKADIIGLKNALNDSEIAQIIKSNGINTDDNTNVKLDLFVDFKVIAADLNKGTILFEVIPKADIITNSNNKTIEIDNNYFNDNDITVKLPIPDHFDLKEILHISNGKYIEQYLKDTGFKINNDVAEITINHFSKLYMNENLTTVAKIDGSDTGYFSLQSAIDAAKSGDVLSLYNNSEDTVIRVVNKDLTIKCNTYTIQNDIDWQLVSCTKFETTDINGYKIIKIVKISDDSSSGSSGSTSDSSGGFITSKNTITVNNINNGSVSVSHTTAKKGDTITITLTPNNGYKLKNLTVIDKNGYTIPVNEISNNKFTFVMPDSKVTIKAEFIKIENIEPTQIPFVDVQEQDYYYNAVLWAVENGITSGTSETTFSPENTCTREQVVTFIWRANGSPKPKKSYNPFNDINADEYYYNAVLWAVENGITSGTSETTFSPKNSCTRGQVATLLWRVNDMPVVSVNSNFNDIPDNAYYENAVNWAVQNNITNGTSNTTFAPNSICTRGQIVTFLYRAFK